MRKRDLLNVTAWNFSNNQFQMVVPLGRLQIITGTNGVFHTKLLLFIGFQGSSLYIFHKNFRFPVFFHLGHCKVGKKLHPVYGKFQLSSPWEAEADFKVRVEQHPRGGFQGGHHASNICYPAIQESNQIRPCSWWLNQAIFPQVVVKICENLEKSLKPPT